MRTENEMVRDDWPPRPVGGVAISGVQRPSFRWSDIWRAPLHDFPIRDEILYQYLPLSSEMDVLEIGPGSGFTSFCLARHVHHLTLVDVAMEAVMEVGGQLQHLSNVRCVCANVTRPRLAEQLKQDFDAVFALDVFEYLVDPTTCLRNLFRILRPGGTLLLTFPNMAPPEGDGVTYFSCLEELESLLEQAGFRRRRIFAVRLRPLAAVIYRTLHEWPLRLYRGLRHGDRDARPQTYELTWAFQRRQQLSRYKIPLHLFWHVLGWMMRLGGDVFKSEPVTNEILGRQLVIQAWR